MRDLWPPWARFWSHWARMGCSFRVLNASRWQLRLPRIPPNVDKSNSMNQTWIFKESAFSRRKIAVFESEGGNPDFRHFFGETTVHRNLRWIMTFRSRASSQSFYITHIISFSSSKSLFSRLLDPLAVDFELPSGPHNPPKPNKTEHKTKNKNTSPAHILDAWQRGGFREAYGDPPRCSRLHGAAIGVWNRDLSKASASVSFL